MSQNISGQKEKKNKAFVYFIVFNSKRNAKH